MSKRGRHVLHAEERETIISWCDTDKNGMIWIHSTQKPMIRRLLKNPLFKLEKEHRCDLYKDPLLGVDGYLPRKALTIRTRIRKATPKQRQALKNAYTARVLRKTKDGESKTTNEKSSVAFSSIKTGE